MSRRTTAANEWRTRGFETAGTGIPSWEQDRQRRRRDGSCNPRRLTPASTGCVQTGNTATDTVTVVYQEFASGEGDMFWAEAMIRHPRGRRGYRHDSASRSSTEYVGQVLTNYVALTGAVTTAGQAWTRCHNPTGPKDATRPAERYSYARIKLVINKPASAGASVVDFDNAYFCLRSSFNGSYALDPLVPEGSKCFKTFSAGWAGWGLVGTNSTMDISAYTNGYLKFWFKAPSVTLNDLIFNWYYGIYSVGYDVQLQSVYNGQTNTVSYSGVTGLTTTNGVQWYQVSIPVNAFTSQGLKPQAVRCPFMITAAMTTAWYVDYVRFEMTP